MMFILTPFETKYLAKLAPINPAAPVIRIGFFKLITFHFLRLNIGYQLLINIWIVRNKIKNFAYNFLKNNGIGNILINNLKNNNF